MPTYKLEASGQGKSDTTAGKNQMKLLTAVIAPNRLERVTAALDAAGFQATIVATAQARQDGGSALTYRGVEYRDQRCVRVEVLLDDSDLDAAVEVVNGAGGRTDGGLTVWASDVDELGGSHPRAGIPEAIGQA